jgi:hypothetical protein
LIITLIFSLAYPIGDKYWQNYLIDVSWNFSSCMVLYILIAKFARENFLAYFLTAAIGSIVAFLRVLVAHGQVQFQEDIITSTVTIILPLIYVLYASLNTATREAESQVTPDSGPNDMDAPLPSVQDESLQSQSQSQSQTQSPTQARIDAKNAEP